MVEIVDSKLMTVKVTVLFLFSLVFVYFLGSLYSASFYITKWPDECRFAVCVLYLLSFTCLALAVIDEEDKKHNGS